MKIAIDRNQVIGSHGASNEKKHRQMQSMGAELKVVPLPVGDYCRIDDRLQSIIDRRGSKLKKIDLIGAMSMSIDTKKDLSEVCSNICSSAHSRFRDELILAQENNIKLIVLVEEKGINSVRDVFSWQNPRMFWYRAQQRKGRAPKSPPTSGQTLAKAMITCSNKYGVEWTFCDREHTGEKIIELLKGD